MIEPFQRTAEELVAELDVDPAQGLEPAEAERRRRRYGANRLRERQRRSAWAVLIEQFRSLIFLLLFAAAAVSFAFREPVQGVAIVIALLINAVIGFLMELRAVRSMEALRSLERVTARVRRAGRIEEIAADSLVPGDIVPLQAGDLVPADLRLLETASLRCDEASLTGESVPVGKTPELLEGTPPLAERRNMVFKGTGVTNGSGLGVVVATGDRTELGRIAELVEEAVEEATPLEKRLDQLARSLLVIILIIAAVVSMVGVVAGRDLLLMVQTGIALIVAAVPEGLPIVASLALARGMWRLAKRNALIEKLAAVETLGGTTVICSDKTGTLTENRMTLARIVLDDGEVVLDAHGPAFRREHQEVSPLQHAGLRAALEVCALCNAASLGKGSALDRRGTGDPMEIALLAGAAAAGLEREALLGELPEVRREEFDPRVKMMATFHQAGDGALVAVKGAPEAVVAAASHVLTADGPVALGEAERLAWHERNEQLAREGLRALAVAEKRVEGTDAEPYGDLTLLGLVGLLDPPRREVKEAIRACRDAGIRVIMITGDQPATARAIAEAVGLVDPGEEVGVMGGPELRRADEMSAKERERVLATSIFARVDPRQKLDLIQIHQAAGARVAMTGDGVNDAPALKKADIGIAMGQRGTQVAREAADMVLQDDSFATIVTAVAQGRVIFSNIRKFIMYLLSGNTGQIFAVSLVAIGNAPLPLLPLQILYINLITDVFPALALGVGRGEDTLAHPARDPAEPILTRRHWYAIGGYGALIGGTVLGIFAYSLIALEVEQERAITISFLAFAFGRLLHVFNMRDAGSHLFRNPIVTNPLVWVAIAIGVALLLAALYVPLLARVLEVADPGAVGWLLIAIGSIVPLVVGQLLKIREVRALVPARLLSEPAG